MSPDAVWIVAYQTVWKLWVPIVLEIRHMPDREVAVFVDGPRFPSLFAAAEIAHRFPSKSQAKAYVGWEPSLGLRRRAYKLEPEQLALLELSAVT